MSAFRKTDPESLPLIETDRGVSSMLLAAVMVVALFDFLFFDRPLGWNAALFVVVVTALAYWRFERLRAEPGGRWLIVPALLAAFGLGVEPNGVLLLLAVLALLSLAVAGTCGTSRSGTAWLERWMRFGLVGWIRSLLDLDQHLQRVNALRRRASGRAPILSGWGMPALAMLIFGTLFVVANPMIEKFSVQSLEQVWEVIGSLLSSARVFVWVCVAIAAWAWLLPRLERTARGPLRAQRLAQRIDTTFAPGRAVLRTLVCCNLLFAFETLLDVTYLWAGATLPEGMTYASYAHRGAYPLIVAALLAGLFILAVFRRGEAARHGRAARGLVYAWLVQTGLLTGSAAWRLALYVDEYSLTRWRFAAAVWMALILTGLFWIGLRLALGRCNRWLVNANLLTALAVLGGGGLTDVDGLIAEYNVRHCREVRGHGARIDLDYLVNLGPESLPAIERLDRPDIPVAAAARDASDRLRTRLARRQLADWRGWTWRRGRLAAAYPMRR